MEYISNSRRRSYKQGKPLFMDADADDEKPMEKKGKNITLENLKFEQVCKWVFSCFDGVEEWEEKHKKYLDEQLRASRGRGTRMSVSSGRCSMSSDQIEYSSNLAPQRTSTLQGLLQKRMALTLNVVGQDAGDKSTKFSTRIGEIAREHIPIYIPTWKGVSNDTKMLIKSSLSRNEDPVIARTNYFLAGHTFSGGSFLTPFHEDKVAEIISNVEKNPESKHYDVDDDPVELAYGPEKKGCVRREGILVTKSMLKHMKQARTIIKEGKLAYIKINNNLNVIIDEVKTLKDNATREGTLMQFLSTSRHVRRNEREVGIHLFNFRRDEVVAVGRAIFPRNQTNNPNEYDILVDLVIDEDAEVFGMWLGSGQIRCNWVTKGAGNNEDKQSMDNNVEMMGGISGVHI
ncbi:hypothetical protein GIB67_013784 [Kingdonia uniflora]|uniref:Uncharacterized protein n=1 Tax=Kingdonia uniflora TaxID=39325 RepID=A0A7J7MNH1_9MAGN|nr:hypothetical protein GIB67_013784 [Kingdonia uniflora]